MGIRKYPCTNHHRRYGVCIRCGYPNNHGKAWRRKQTQPMKLLSEAPEWVASYAERLWKIKESPPPEPKKPARWDQMTDREKDQWRCSSGTWRFRKRQEIDEALGEIFDALTRVTLNRRGRRSLPQSVKDVCPMEWFRRPVKIDGKFTPVRPRIEDFWPK